MVKLPFLKKSKTFTNKFLTLEINSTHVRCLAFYQEETKAKIIGYGVQKLEYGSVRSGLILDHEDVEKATKISVAQAIKSLEENIDLAIVNVTGDLCLGLTTTVKLNRGKNGPIEKREINKMYEKILEAAYMQIQNDYLDMTGNPDADLEVITTSNVYLKINGQEVTHLEGKEGRVIEAAVFNAFAPRYHIESVEEIIKRCGLSLFALGYNMYTIAQQVESSSLESTDYVIIDVSNDATNVGVIFGKGIIATKNINIGYSHFIEALSEKMGLTLIEAEKILIAHIEEKLTPGESAIVHESILETLEIWLTGLEILFGEFRGVKTFASKVYLTGIGTHIPSLVETVEKEPWMKSIPFKEPPDFKKLDFMALEKISDATGKINTEEWLTPAGLSIIFEEKLRHD